MAQLAPHMETIVLDVEYRAIMLQKLRLPLPLALEDCACGGLLDELGENGSMCAQVKQYTYANR